VGDHPHRRRNRGAVKGGELDLDSAAIPVAHPRGDEYDVIDIQAWSDPRAAMKAIVPIIKFFPANPADWTTSPLAK
jgi:hypothetical protein